MRDLNIAYGNNRQAKRWVNKTIKFDELKEKLKVPIRTTESAEEYAKMSKAQRDNAKDHGGFVGGVLKDGRRKIDTVTQRSMIALDGDRIDKGRSVHIFKQRILCKNSRTACKPVYGREYNISGACRG